MTDFAIDLKGIEAVQRAFNNLDKRLSSKYLVKALRLAAAPMKKTARQLAYPADKPHRISRGTFAGVTMPPGNLRKSIDFIVLKNYPPVAYIGPERGAGKKFDTYYAHWVEYGRFKSYNDTILPRPYMRPAWDINKRKSMAIIETYLRGVLEKAGKWDQ